MNTLTFKFDCQLNDNEDWIKEGTKVQVSSNQFHVNRFKDSTPVIITEALDIDGNKVKLIPYVEWFMNSCFVELNGRA
jgi:mRNA-degrading endonuclease HigB of HigAB toxin-antitoxin module